MTKQPSPYSIYLRQIQEEFAPNMKLSEIRKIPIVKHTWKCIQLQKKVEECKDKYDDELPQDMLLPIPLQKTEPFHHRNY